MKTTKNSNELINWVEDFILVNNIKYYKYENFYNIEKIGNQIYRANCKNSEQHFVLKSFNIIDNDILKEELIHEFKLQSKVNFHNNLINFFGITDKENQNGQMKEYLLVMEYANGGSLRDYLKENFNNLTWKDKYELAYQLACAILFLHDKGIAYHDLYPGNIFFHQKTIKLANFTLLNRIKRVSENQSGSFDKILYIDPKRLNDNNELIQSYSLNEKSHVYAFGMILWEISSGRPSFEDESNDANLIKKILQGYRETNVLGTPVDYSNLYTECWNNEPNKRPTMRQVIYKLRAMVTKSTQLFNSSNVIRSDTNDCLLYGYGKLSHMIEIEPTIQQIHENIFEEDLSIIIDKFVNIYFKEINEGIEESVCRESAFGYIDDCKISIQEIYHWLLINQDCSNSIYLLGYFNYHGIVTDINKEKALELYEKAAVLENNMAQLKLVYMYKDGEVCDRNYKKAFELSKKLAEIGLLGGLNLLGYCYCSGIGTEINMQKAFELYQKATILENPKAQYNLALMYEFGEGVEIDFDKAFELAKKSAEGKYLFGISLLGCYYNLGIGTNVDIKKAFGLYKKAADLGNYDAQYHLALLYESGNGVEKDINKAIYWYKQSAKQGFQNAQIKLENLQE
ncbi:uncharacterized protein OCT59_023942 [Rhizophagus irregularis]|uniref:Ipl1p n=2 Tax=Rhizophagus irregularis TaxID=588596 RepID=A0A015I8S5_RHIIW|nr:kinase-like domain-containing protein [Rhizophagus irregularis DAOM 181602=DAOM 197198]EXX50180.1 Ipl1p [Rhizophagus irregularis DAOM 197198w]POG68356.1 kinase-like domain-containing protein [Rhizophagus irregularis DAOM 181602=DAOM 197198]UZO03535.1 hypothetical protein OCT59_023942 [Rhizophagus irregularis]GBC22037.1 kinase-like domain-containing protein [Rhizophagus irregularis DAOM 181602=DAOM 197198]|eukprot:XP_025175222.1 kinase-like domain-containing protein [Rhizophagus irregularis DAOM 181602=DAOM 197198]